MGGNAPAINAVALRTIGASVLAPMALLTVETGE